MIVFRWKVLNEFRSRQTPFTIARTHAKLTKESIYSSTISKRKAKIWLEFYTVRIKRQIEGQLTFRDSIIKNPSPYIG